MVFSFPWRLFFASTLYSREYKDNKISENKCGVYSFFLQSFLGWSSDCLQNGKQLLQRRLPLFFNRGRTQVTCETQPPNEPRDDRYGGPTPLGEYLIGKKYTNPQYNIDWYNLYPKKEDNSGYYGYTQPTRTGRYAMGLHPRQVSLGCVTVKAPTYNSDRCWRQISAVVDSGNMHYRGSSYSGFLYVR